jgi:hypothetical protein
MTSDEKLHIFPVSYLFILTCFISEFVQYLFEHPKLLTSFDSEEYSTLKGKSWATLQIATELK